jgi:RND family efflux transporter MFP subunit
MMEQNSTPVVDPETANDTRSAMTNVHTDVVRAHDEPHAERHVDNPGGGKVIGLLFALAVLGAIGYGIHARQAHEKNLATTTEQESVPTVQVTHATVGSKSGELTLPGSVSAFVETPIYSRTNGYLKKWFYDIGSRVKQGALLAVIETPETDQQLLQSRAELERQQANAELAGTTSKRWESLLAKHAVSQQEADQAKSNYIAAQAAVDASRANVKRLEELQSYERILAPFNGVITARNTDIGDLINAGSGNTNPRELFHLADTRMMRVYAAVPEVYADRIHNGDTATITQDSNPNQEISGKIVRNSNAIDRTTRTLNVEVDIDNKDGLLRPGAYVFVHFKMPGARGTFTIPSASMLFRAAGAQVATVKDGRIKLTSIKIGHDYGDTVEVLSGISADDQIVLSPPDSLAEGSPVHAQEAAPAKKGGQ